jgi:hypothetical protein
MGRFLPAILGIFLIHISGVAVAAQDRGTLSATATVVTSVALVTDANGIPRIVVANPSAANDNVSSISYAPSMFPNAERSKDPNGANVHRTGKGKRVIVPGHPGRRREDLLAQTVSSPSF